MTGEVGVDRQVAALGHQCRRGAQHAGQVRGRGHGRRAGDLDALHLTVGRPLGGGAVQQGARGGLGGLHVRLVEGVDPEQAAGHRGGHLPQQQLGAERAGDLHAVARGRDVVLADELHLQQVGGVPHGLGVAGGDDDGQQPGAVLARGLGDQLLDPGRQSGDAGPVVGEDELVAQRAGAAQGRAELQARVVLVVGDQQVEHGLRVVQQGRDVHAGQAGGDQAERGEGRETPAHGRVRGEDGAPAGGLARGVQR